ncbi:nodulation protein NodD [Synechococcus sp. MU1651]|uniref:nodulation protein NodD n=1 Tax=Synechococcus sp. MU1651 TaxID=2508353 RepID=UPI0020263E75|nr:nodulation protein NodD [Synechococcus sp. MU1651]
MLNAYLFCLLAGMVLISLSLNDDVSGDGEGGPLSLLFSTPFWSFGLTGFGLSGLLMQLLVGNSAGWFSQLIALSIGGGMGLAATRLLRMIGRREADSLVRSDDLIGLEGVVTLAMDAEQRGFVELSVRGTLLRRPALSCKGALAPNTKVVVVASDDHTLRVETLQPPSL